MSYILTFTSTHEAICAEKALRQAGYPVGVLPMPTEIHAGCGIALRVDDRIAAKTVLEENHIPVAAAYQAVANNSTTVYIPCRP